MTATLPQGIPAIIKSGNLPLVVRMSMADADTVAERHAEQEAHFPMLKVVRLLNLICHTPIDLSQWPIKDYNYLTVGVGINWRTIPAVLSVPM